MNAAAAATPIAFPWEEAMAFGFGALRLNAHDFWRLSPRELAAAMRAGGADRAPALRRSEFAALLQRYPD